MILMTEAVYDRFGKALYRYPMLEADLNKYHIVFFHLDRWTFCMEVDDKAAPGWKDFDWNRLKGARVNAKSTRLRLVECSTGLVRDANTEDDIKALPITDDDYKKYYKHYTTAVRKTLRAEWVVADKSLGQLLTKKNARQNRECRESRMSYLETEIRNLRWLPSNQGIGIDVLGNLVDGQHRLRGLRDTGWPEVMILIVSGLPVASRLVVDSGLNRSIKDNMKFLYGVEMPACFVGAMRMSIMWVWRPEDQDARAVGTAEVFSWYQDSQAEYDYMLSLRRKNLPSPVLAAFADIARFAKRSDVLVMYEKFTDPKHEPKVGSAIWALRKTLPKIQVKTSGDKKSGFTLQRHRYNMTATAIFSFLAGDRKHWDCDELLNNHDQTRESLSLAVGRFSKKPVRVRFTNVKLTGTAEATVVSEAAA